MKNSWGSFGHCLQERTNRRAFSMKLDVCIDEKVRLDKLYSISSSHYNPELFSVIQGNIWYN